MIEQDEGGGFAYQIHVKRKKYWHGTIGMLRDVFRMLFGCQIGVVIVGLAGAITRFWGFGWSPDVLKWLVPLSFSVYGLLPFFIWRNYRATSQLRRRTRRGTTVVEPGELQKRLPQGGRIHLCEGVTLPLENEVQHLISTGCTGSGKTVLLRQIFSGVRHLKGMIYGGKSGELASQFHRPGHDILFNEYDERSIHVDLFSICQDDASFDAIARSVIPDDATNHSFFNQAGQQLLSGILRYCALEQPTNEAVYRTLNLPQPELHARLRDVYPEAASYCDAPTNMTQSALATLRQFAGPCFRHLQNPARKPWFDLKEWVLDPDRKGYLFLNTMARQRQALKRTQSLLIEIICQLKMNQPDDINPDTRFVFLCDEWASLPAMSCMTQLLFEGRSKNVMMGLLFQNVSQAITTYGESTARAIIDSASCYVIFRANDVQTAEFWSRALGSAEVDFTETSLSAGERQGSESYRYVRQMDLAVMASEIQRLADLECFISMANQPVTRGKLEYQDYPKVQPAFVPAENDGPRVGSRDAAQKSDQPDSQSNRHENPSQTGMEKDFDIEKFDF